mmetsp:Transcript_20847/g.60684  ORF Transcript_20847/g.60684 Transcript_20847/m.60684 type:complete len:496 (-) Transcript_20847:446-1933(-)
MSQSRHRRGFFGRGRSSLAPLTTILILVARIATVRCLLTSPRPPRLSTERSSRPSSPSSSSSSPTALGIWPGGDDDDDYDYDELLQSDAEQSRIRRRTVMDDDRWLKHRASDRFFRNLGTIFDSYVFKNLLDEVGVIMLVCFLIIGWNQCFFDGYDALSSMEVRHIGPPLADTAFGASPYAIPLKLPTQAFTISASPLGLLLVFRTNTSYNRWLEGRKAWDQVVTGCRDLMLMASVWTDPRDGAPKEEVEDEESAQNRRREREDALRRLGTATWAVPRALRKHISGPWDPNDDFAAEVTAALGDGGGNGRPSAAERILNARHKPYRALYDLHKVVHRLPNLEATHRTLMGRAVLSISRAGTECERLYTTPVPLSYTRHTARFLTLWLLTLPLALYDSFGYSWNHIGMIPTVGALSFLFFGIEEIAVSLEEPFSILPLDQLTEDSRLAAADVLAWAFEEEEGGDDVQGSEGGFFGDGQPAVPDILPYNDTDQQTIA